MDVFKLSRDFFDWSFENPELITPTHSAIYFFAIEHCNRLWWKEKFWFPTSMAMEAIWIRKWETYNKAFRNLVDWWFIKEIEKSKNQYSSCIISIWSATPKNGKALDKALVKHGKKHSESTGESTGVIDIQETNKQDTSIFTDFIGNPENESATFYLIKNFLLLWWNPSKEETVETIREWMKEVFSENEVEDSTTMKKSIDIWYEYWKEEKKPKNVKSTFRSTIKFSIPWKKQ